MPPEFVLIISNDDVKDNTDVDDDMGDDNMDMDEEWGEDFDEEAPYPQAQPLSH